jgi:hypothetical protein
VADKEKKNESAGCGCGGFGLGSVIAVVISWSVNHSVLWAAIHGFLGWFYIVYYLLTGQTPEKP